MLDAHPVIALIFGAFAHHGDARYDETVSQRDHALQCAQHARDHGCADPLIAAALLHDIGRMIDPDGNAIERAGIDARHEAIAARVLARFFPSAVTEPIRLHVDAKRYLCAVDPAYLSALSAASLHSLDVQGGAMHGEERRRFEAEPFFAEALLLRRFDDRGERPQHRVTPLAAYRPLLLGLCTTPLERASHPAPTR